MRLHLLQLPKLIAERRSSAIFGMVIIAMLWAGVCLKYAGDVEEDRREAERANRNFAMVFEENVLRSIGEIDKALLYLRRSIETRKETTDYHTIVNTADVLSEIIVQVAIIDSTGLMRASNAGPQPAPPVDLSDREHYKVHVKSDDDRLFISKPVVGRVSGQWSVQFTRRFSNSDGSFAGVVVASLNPKHLTNFYNKIDFGASVSISLIGSDGVVRSSGGNAGGYVLGDNLSGSKLLSQIRAGSNTTFEEIAPSDGEARLFTVRKVKDHPLWVSVGAKKDEIYKDSSDTLMINAIVSLVLTLMILAAMERILQSEEKARQKSDQLRFTLESMSQGIMLVTKDREIPIINGRCGELLDLPPEFIHSPPSFDELVEYQNRHGKLRDVTPSLGRQLLEGEEAEAAPGRFAVREHLTPSGSVVEVRTGHLPDGSLVQTFTDITKRWEAEAHVNRLASEDPLTGLPNRRVFRSTLDQMCQARASLTGDDAAERDFALLFLDLDRFKVINDTLGHRVGDLLLQEVAQRIRLSLPSTYILSRLGGDEFAIIVPMVAARGELAALAGRLVETVSHAYEIDGYQIRSSVSIGIAVGPHDGANADELLMAADLALYAVKADSRGTHRFFEGSMNREVNERRQIEMDLRAAIERNELELHYQPIVNLRRNGVIGFEALARWRHPLRGMVPPAEFIPIAEDSGIILNLGEWALIEACSQAVKWPDDLIVAVNLSPVQLTAPNLCETVERILKQTGLAPHRLELEITERIFIENSESTMEKLRSTRSRSIARSFPISKPGWRTSPSCRRSSALRARSA
jgi:diguanylate cyclase (GGDEF)-like protein